MATESDDAPADRIDRQGEVVDCHGTSLRRAGRGSGVPPRSMTSPSGSTAGQGTTPHCRNAPAPSPEVWGAGWTRAFIHGRPEGAPGPAANPPTPDKDERHRKAI